MKRKECNMCVCGHSILHHFPNKRRKGFFSPNSNRGKPIKNCDVKLCLCKEYKEKKEKK